MFFDSAGVELSMVVILGQSLILVASLVFGKREWSNDRRAHVLSSCLFVFLISLLTVLILLSNMGTHELLHIPSVIISYMELIRDVLLMFFLLGIAENLFRSDRGKYDKRRKNRTRKE